MIGGVYTLTNSMGERIKKLRRERNLTQHQLGEMLGVRTSAISMYEKDQRSANYEIIIKLSEIFNCSLDFLIKGEEDIDTKLKNIMKDELLIAFEDYDSWSVEDKEELLSYLTAKKLTRQKYSRKA